MIQFMCPHCRKQIQAKDDAAGKVVACPLCERTVKLPAPRTTPPASERVTRPPPAPAPPAPASPPAPPASAGESSPLAAHPQLGDLVDFYSNEATRQEKAYALGCLGAVVLTGLALLGFFWNALHVAVIVIALVVVAIVAFLIFDIARGKRTYRVYLCRNGFLLQTEKNAVHLWTEATGLLDICEGASSMQAHAPRLRLATGEEIAFEKNFVTILDFTRHLTELVLPVFVRRVEAALDKGQEVAFGEEISISPRGLTVRKQPLTWSKIECIKVGVLLTEAELKAEAQKGSSAAVIGGVVGGNVGGIAGAMLGAAAMSMGSAALRGGPTSKLTVLHGEDGVEQFDQIKIPNLGVLLQILERRFKVYIQRPPLQSNP